MSEVQRAARVLRSFLLLLLGMAFTAVIVLAAIVAVRWLVPPLAGAFVEVGHALAGVLVDAARALAGVPR